MTLSVGGVALICLLLLLFFGNGRLRMLAVALCAAVVGGILTQVGATLIGIGGDIVAAVTNAFT